MAAVCGLDGVHAERADGVDCRLTRISGDCGHGNITVGCGDQGFLRKYSLKLKEQVTDSQPFEPAGAPVTVCADHEKMTKNACSWLEEHPKTA